MKKRGITIEAWWPRSSRQNVGSRKRPAGGSQSQVFELAGWPLCRSQVPENQQGERVLASKFLSCALAETLHLALNRALLVAVDAGCCENRKRVVTVRQTLRPEFAAGCWDFRTRSALSNSN